MQHYKRTILSVLFVPMLAIVFMLAFSVTLSPFYSAQHFDSYMFQIMGQLINRGGVPYVDLFDNKGLLIYLINAWGQQMGRYGVLVLEILSLIGTMLCWEQICLVFKMGKSRYGVLFIALLMMLRFFSSGNLTEEWSLLPISLSMLLFLRAKKYHNYQAYFYQYLVLGLCMGMAFHLRANNMAPILSIGIWWIVMLWRSNSVKTAFKALLGVSVGFVALTSFLILFMYHRGGWNGVYEMFYNSIYFNIGYALHYNATSTIGFWSAASLGYWAVNIMIILLPCFLLREAKNEMLPILFAGVFTVLSMGRSLFIHYQMVLVPLFVVCVALLFRNKHRWLVVCLVLVFARFSIVSITVSYTAYHESSENRCFVDEFRGMIKNVPEEEQNQIWNAAGGNFMDAFSKTGYIPCNRFMLPLGLELSARFEAEESDGISSVQPKWVLTSEETENMISPQEREYFLLNYKLISQTHSIKRDIIYLYRHV